MASLHAPLPTLRRNPRGGRRTARGRCGSLLLHRNGLSPSTPCQSPGAILSANSGSRRQGGEASDARLGALSTIEPVDNPRHVHRGGDANLLKPGLSQTDVAAPTHAEGTDALRERAFHPGSDLVALLPGRFAHPPPRRVERLVLGTWMEIDMAAHCLGRGAQVLGGEGPTVRSAELSHDARAAVDILDGAPGHRDLALRAGDLLAFPVDRKVGQVIALSGTGLPACHASNRPLERDIVIEPAADQQSGVDIGGVHEVLRG